MNILSARGPILPCLCEEPAGDKAISGHYATGGQIAAAFGLAMTFLGARPSARNDFFRGEAAAIAAAIYPAHFGYNSYVTHE
jgi:hypothetical protein